MLPVQPQSSLTKTPFESGAALAGTDPQQLVTRNSSIFNQEASNTHWQKLSTETVGNRGPSVLRNTAGDEDGRGKLPGSREFGGELETLLTCSIAERLPCC